MNLFLKIFLGILRITLLTIPCLALSPAANKRALVSESQCDDYQDAIMANPLWSAVLLANATIGINLPDGTNFRRSTAFGNYFEDADYPVVSKMMQNINDYTFKRELRSPSLWFLCSQPDSVPETCKRQGTLVFPDPDPTSFGATLPSSGFGFCDAFFDPQNAQVQTFVWSKNNEEWCRDGVTSEDYYTAGFLTMKLFAQIDAYGSMSGLPPRPAESQSALPQGQTHGAMSLDPPQGQSESSMARMLKQAIATDMVGTLPHDIQRVQNAASFAAAATEWYFLLKCRRSRDFRIPLA